jgi:iron complex outermembrane receptor protein
VSGARAVGTVGGTSAVVLQPAEIRSSPAPLLDQALRESPFVHVRLNSRGETELSIRGSDARQAAVLLDGVPITIGWDHRTDPSVIPITGSDRLVVVRGVGSLLNGPNTSGGTIEVAHDPLAQAGTRLNAGLGVDENGSVVGTLSAGRQVADVAGGALSIRGGLAYRQRDGVTLPSGALDPTSVNGLRTNTDLRENDGFGSIRWSNLLGRSIGLTVSAMDAEKGVAPEEHLSAPRLWRYPYNRRTVAAFSASTGTFATPFGYGSFEVGAGYNGGRLKIESYSARDYQTVNAVELGDERTMTGRAMARHSAGPATIRAGLTLADVRYEETLVPAGPVDYRQKMRSIGLEGELPFGRTSLAAGFVMDRTATPETGGRAAQEPFESNGWRAGITHDLSDAWRLHASASERSRFPALRELYSGALNRFTPNPDLKPETSLGMEGGVTMQRSLGPIPQAGFTVTGFRNRLEDAVVRITVGDPPRFMRVNRDRIESTGLELLGGFVFGQDAERAVTVNADATLQNISIFDQTANNAERHAENNPERRGRVELGLPLPWQLRGSATARHTGTQYCLNGETGLEMKLNAATTTDLSVTRAFPVRGNGLFGWLRTVLSLDNVANTAVYDQCGLPQPGRTLRLMMTIG